MYKFVRSVSNSSPQSNLLCRDTVSVIKSDMIALQLCSCCPLASLPRGALVDCGIVNSQILAEVYFRKILRMRMRSFVKVKHSRNGEITLSITDVDKSCLICVACLIFNVANIPFTFKNIGF